MRLIRDGKSELIPARYCYKTDLDDEMSGWEIYGNIFKNATTGILLGGGRRNNM